MIPWWAQGLLVLAGAGLMVAVGCAVGTVIDRAGREGDRREGAGRHPRNTPRDPGGLP